MSFAAFLVTRSVIGNFASNPPTGNAFAIRIAITVRTLLMGISTMATAVFGMIAIGLLLLGIKSLLAPEELSEAGVEFEQLKVLEPKCRLVWGA